MEGRMEDSPPFQASSLPILQTDDQIPGNTISVIKSRFM